jgi:pimeloyl-ACP methyl ester carboxylesterase
LWIVALDTPGFGQSFFPPDPPTSRYYVLVLAEALQNLGVERFHIFGHHSGAQLGAEMAAVMPERVASLSLLGPPYYSDPRARSEWLDSALQPMVVREDGSHLQQIWKRVRDLDLSASPAVWHREAVDTLRAGERWHEAYVAVGNQNFESFLRQVKCSMMLLCGETDVLASHFHAACEALPDVEAHLLPGGTYAADACAETLALTIAEFVASAEQFVANAEQNETQTIIA